MTAMNEEKLWALWLAILCLFGLAIHLLVSMTMLGIGPR